MIKKLLAIDGIMAVAAFRDDGAFVEGYGMLPDEQLAQLAHFAHDYKRLVQGNVTSSNGRGACPAIGLDHVAV